VLPPVGGLGWERRNMESKHQPRAHAHPSLAFRVVTSYTTGTLYAILQLVENYSEYIDEYYK
jgi:hypothetical protein